MIISSTTFLIFLSVFFLIYAICPAKYRRFLMLLGSLVFCIIDGIFGLITALGFACANYLLGLLVQTDAKHQRKTWLTVGILVDAGLLLTISILAMTGTIASKPTGLSYYTFAGIAYLVDIWRGECRSESNLLNYVGYTLFFPKYVQGPIVRYGELRGQIDKPKTTVRRLQSGLELFILGFCMKVLIADRMGIIWDKEVFQTVANVGAANITTGLAWLGAYSYSVQIYVDWQGYMLMVIGVGRMLGFELPPNFNDPYLAKTVGDYFRRWHMTLTRWFKDYIYIPLGGNRRGTGRTVLNILIVWLLTAVWHAITFNAEGGFSWNFMIWGLSIGILIVLEKLFFGKWMEKLRILPHLYVLFVIPLTWVCFNTAIGNELGVYFGRLFPFFGSAEPLFKPETMKEIVSFNVGKVLPYLIPGVLFCTPIPEKLVKKFSGSVILSVILTVLFWIAVYVCIKNGGVKSMYA